MVALILIYSIGHLSGVYFNPAVTLDFWRSGVFQTKRVLPYILAQSVGAIAQARTQGFAFLILLLLSLGNIAKLRTTLPLNDNWLPSLILETVSTFILMLIILGSGLDRRAHIGFASLAIGLTVG